MRMPLFNPTWVNFTLSPGVQRLAIQISSNADGTLNLIYFSLPSIDMTSECAVQALNVALGDNQTPGTYTLMS